MYEDNELKIVYSSRRTKLHKHQRCSACDLPLEKGQTVISYGIWDKKEQVWTREYYCSDHSHILANTNTEDLEEWEQQYLIDNRFANEFYPRT